MCNTMRTASLLQKGQVGQCQNLALLQMVLPWTQHETPWLHLRYGAQKQDLSPPTSQSTQALKKPKPLLSIHNPAFFTQLPQSRTPRACSFLLVLQSNGMGGAAGSYTHLPRDHLVLPVSHLAQGSNILILEPHLLLGFTLKKAKEHLAKDKQNFHIFQQKLLTVQTKTLPNVSRM